ncbi:MAG: glycosyltransferase [Candidatus Marsarchaeota archaeon]|nr:glycosyltransferase [Candidatus Marsarchaeota archaeon]
MACVAIGSYYYLYGIGPFIEHALHTNGHSVIYVGPASPERPGYDSSIPIDQLLSKCSPYPDLFLWVDPATRYFPRGIEKLPIPTACYLIDVHLGTWRESAARFFDAVFIAQRDSLPRYRAAVGHDQVYWLPLGASPKVHYRHDLPRIYEVGFVGNMVLAHRKTLRALRLRLIAEHFRTNDLSRVYTPAEVGVVYSQSLIVANVSISGDVNMRVFEGTACGALMLTDSVANGLEELFVLGREVVTYRDDADMLDMITYYLAHEEERAHIAEACYLHTQHEHLYTRRFEYLMERILSPRFKRLAPRRSASRAECSAVRRDIYTHLHMLDAILDEASANGEKLPLRAYHVLPCLVRRLII